MYLQLAINAEVELVYLVALLFAKGSQDNQNSGTFA